MWAAGYGGTAASTATRRAAPTTPPAASMAPRSARTSASASTRCSALRWAAAAPTSTPRRGSAAAAPTCSRVGVYGRHNFGAAYVAGALAYGWQDVTTDRTVTVAGTDRLRANFNAQTFAARIEGGYRFATALMGVTPYARVAGDAGSPAGLYRVRGVGLQPVRAGFASQTENNVRSELGVRSDKSFACGQHADIARRAAWAHDSNTDRAVSPTFQSLPGCIVHGQWREARRRRRARQRRRRDEMAQRLVGRRPVRGRVLPHHRELLRQGHREVRVVRAAA